MPIMKEAQDATAQDTKALDAATHFSKQGGTLQYLL